MTPDMNEMQHARDALRFWVERVGRIAGLKDAHQKSDSDEITAFAVTTDRGERYILKNITAKLNAKRVETEYDLLQHLQAFDVPVAVPIPSDSAQLCVEDQDRIYLLYPVLPVDHDITPADTQRVYANIGAAVARLHRALALYPGHIESWTMNLPHALFEEAIPRIRSALTEREWQDFHHIVAELQDELVAAVEDLPVQLIHGDCHGGNYLLCDGDVSGFVDLDHLPTGPRVYDIGYLLADMAKARFVGNPAHRDWLAHFCRVIAGYQRENSLSGREKDALWFVMLATQVLFVDWFFQHDRDELARKNLEAFYWIFRQRDEITHRISGV